MFTLSVLYAQRLSRHFIPRRAAQLPGHPDMLDNPLFNMMITRGWHGPTLRDGLFRGRTLTLFQQLLLKRNDARAIGQMLIQVFGDFFWGAVSPMEQWIGEERMWAVPPSNGECGR